MCHRPGDRARTTAGRNPPKRLDSVLANAEKRIDRLAVIAPIDAKHPFAVLCQDRLRAALCRYDNDVRMRVIALGLKRDAVAVRREGRRPSVADADPLWSSSRRTGPGINHQRPDVVLVLVLGAVRKRDPVAGARNSKITAEATGHQSRLLGIQVVGQDAIRVCREHDVSVGMQHALFIFVGVRDRRICRQLPDHGANVLPPRCDRHDHRAEGEPAIPPDCLHEVLQDRAGLAAPMRRQDARSPFTRRAVNRPACNCNGWWELRRG